MPEMEIHRNAPHISSNKNNSKNKASNIYTTVLVITLINAQLILKYHKLEGQFKLKDQI
jgi:hypothetical protein